MYPPQHTPSLHPMPFFFDIFFLAFPCLTARARVCVCVCTAVITIQAKKKLSRCLFLFLLWNKYRDYHVWLIVIFTPFSYGKNMTISKLLFSFRRMGKKSIFLRFSLNALGETKSILELESLAMKPSHHLFLLCKVG